MDEGFNCRILPQALNLLVRSTTKRSNLLLLALIASCLTASTATAATVEYRTIYLIKGGDSAVTYIAEPGEANRLTVLYTPRAVTFRDESAEIGVRGGPECELRGPHEAECVRPGQLTVDVGDGDDHAQIEASIGPARQPLIVGGPGEDRLTARSEGVRGVAFAGGEGADTMIGGNGADSFIEGRDRSSGDGYREAPVDTDVVDGGPGVDLVDYFGRTSPVTVDLTDPRGDGGIGEEDQITGVEGVQGGRADDLLTGDSQPNTLLGGCGNDLIAGGGGNDFVHGGGGADRLLGGPGNDRLSLVELDVCRSGEDSVACGGGFDRVDAPHSEDRLRSCELVSLLVSGYGFGTTTTLGGWPLPGRERDTVALRVYCRRESSFFQPQAYYYHDGCYPRRREFALILERPRGTGRGSGLPLGSATFTLGARRSERIEIRLTPRGRRYLGQPGPQLLRVSVKHPRSSGRYFVASFITFV